MSDAKTDPIPRQGKRTIEMWGKKIEGVDMTRLLTAAEVAAFVRVPAERLVELADLGCAPHARIDGGEPLFAKMTLRTWVNRYLVDWTDGDELPPAMKIYEAAPEYTPSTLPRCLQSIDGLLELPAGWAVPPCVYFLIAGDEVVYIGKSVSLVGRLHQHRHGDGDTCVKVFDRVVYLRCPQSRMSTIELELIRRFAPKYNVQGLSRDQRERRDRKRTRSRTIKEQLSPRKEIGAPHPRASLPLSPPPLPPPLPRDELPDEVA